MKKTDISMKEIEGIAKKQGFDFSWSSNEHNVVFHIYVDSGMEFYTAITGCTDFNYTKFEMVNYRDERLVTRDISKVKAFLNAI